MKMLRIVKKADEVLAFVLKSIAVGLCLAIAFILLGRVILRLPFFTSSMAWSEEIVELTMAWMILTVATLLFRSGEHFRVELLEKKLHGRTSMKIVHLFITLVSLLFMGMLFYYGIKFMQPQPQFSPILKISHRVYYASVPVNAGLSMLYLLRDLVRDTAALAEPSSPSPEKLCEKTTDAELIGEES